MTLDLQFYHRLLGEKLSALHSAVDQLLSVIGENDQTKKVEAAHSARGAVDSLNAALSTADRPQWASDLQRVLSRYTDRATVQGEPHRLLRSLMLLEPAMRAQSWPIADRADAIDFERVYARYSEDSRLDELFDELIRGLEEIIASGSVDSVRIMHALETILSTLRRNARSSLPARKGALQVTSAFIQNLGWEALSDIPGVGAVARALRTTLADAEVEVQRVEEQSRQEIVQVATASLPARLISGGDQRLLLAPVMEGASAPVAEDAHTAGPSSSLGTPA